MLLLLAKQQAHVPRSPSINSSRF